MEKYIYKVTNLINGKVYIGQTTDYKRRFSEHKAMAGETNKPLYLAMKKYGIENFSFEVIEDKTSDYNEREEYWIKYYHSYINDPKKGGYNVTMGGDAPPLHIREDSPFATHSEEEVFKIKKLLKETKIQYQEIAKQFNYDSSTIERINYGKLWRDEGVSYPLRKDTSRAFQEQRAREITFDLLNTTMTQKEIAEKHGCARSTVTAINQGVNFAQSELTYPLRKQRVTK